MPMIHVWHWILNFMGVNFGQNNFSTHMYNFWSGFGGDITEFALIGTIITIYRHHMKSIRIKNIIHKVTKSPEDKDITKNDSDSSSSSDQ